MPTIFIVLGFRFMYYSNEHSPIHVHVTKGGCNCKIHHLASDARRKSRNENERT